MRGHIFFYPGSTRSAGVAILFSNSPGKLSRTSNNGHWLICVLNIDEQYSILVNVYGVNNLTQNS